MSDMSSESKRTIQDLAMIAEKNKIRQHQSLKKKRETASDVLLRAQNIKHGEKCKRCSVNCAVKHAESEDFWAVIEGTEPKYTLETCPRQGKLEKDKIKMKKRKR
jgi:hypothetical protein